MIIQKYKHINKNIFPIFIVLIQYILKWVIKYLFKREKIAY